MVEKLSVEEGDLKGLVFSFDNGDNWSLGRDPDQNQFVVEDPLVSRKHMIAQRTSEGITIQNVSHTNPIWLNNEEINETPHLLHDQDTIKIGNELFRFFTDAATYVETPVLEPESLPSLKEEINKKNAEEPDEEVFQEVEPDELAEINFGLAETGRWLLKVVSGPNVGAEFYMKTGHSYVIGTDPHTCDIVFHDTSVSRQHARISVTNDDTLKIEDLKSRNGVLVAGETIEGQQSLLPSVIVTMGTTSFVVYDREGEMQTIISPLLPSIVKVLQHEQPKAEASADSSSPPPPEPTAPPPPQNHLGQLILLSIIIGAVCIIGFGVITLFRSQPIEQKTDKNAVAELEQALAPFPAVKFYFNKNTGSLLLIGHVLTPTDKNELLYNLQGMPFIKYTDDSGIIIDEYVWREFNDVLSHNPTWNGVSIHATAPGQFVLTGYLQTRKQAAQLADYVSINFAYLDLLKKEVTVEEDVINQVNIWLQEAGINGITTTMINGEVVLKGTAAQEMSQALQNVISKVKTIPGVRIVTNLVDLRAIATGVQNISEQYLVTGQTKVGSKYTVVINGRLYSQGDVLDGKTITDITATSIFLTQDGNQFRIDYNK